ncbi:hypothetical protein BDP27DRAFT_1370594 [Rhodocollybia butyracea]|uniref:Uncharacterized protein n=1 Tax=Rhodocollybia butyracea TaxID=206335 RepID=A0A9P5P7M5_9AGAR|nr:hypothetical protein BDP27DRAFT_1370594 [Rhodocollybia butyracea]
MSSAQLTGLSLLGNGQIIEGKSLLFDANFYISEGETLFGAFRYFNNEDRQFRDKGLFEIRALVAKMPEGGIKVGEEQLEDSEYDLIGDVTWLHEVASPNPKQRPYIDVIGIAQNVITKEATFDMNPQQYTYVLSDRRNDSILPLRAIIPDSPRYKVDKRGKSNKPVPKQSSPLAASGYLTRVIPKEGDKEQHPERFCMSVESVTFLGQSTAPDPLPDSSTQVRVRKGKRKQVANFDDLALDYLDDEPVLKKEKIYCRGKIYYRFIHSKRGSLHS